MIYFVYLRDNTSETSSHRTVEETNVGRATLKKEI